MSEYSLTDVMKKRGAYQILFSASTYIGADEEAQELLADLALSILMDIRKGPHQRGVMQIWTVRLKALDAKLVGKHWNPDRPISLPEVPNVGV